MQRFPQRAILFPSLRGQRASLEASCVISPLPQLFRGSRSEIPDSRNCHGHIELSIFARFSFANRSNGTVCLFRGLVAQFLIGIRLGYRWYICRKLTLSWSEKDKGNINIACLAAA